jgi:hypothetical protein
MSDVQYVQYWTKYVQYWTTTAISQQSDYGQGWFYNLYINFSPMNSHPICPILDNMSDIYILGKEFLFQTCQLSADVQYWTNVESLFVCLLEQISWNSYKKSACITAAVTERL